MSLAKDIIRLCESIEDLSKKSDTLNTLSNKAKQMYARLIKGIRENAYPEAVEYIEDVVKDPKLRFLLSLGFGGELATLFLSSEIEHTPVKGLVPTQNEIDLSSSLAWSINGKKSVSYMFQDSATIVAPVVTFKNAFIIDGHHRWSQAYCTNPNLKITCLNFSGDLSPISMLKAVQATIGSNTGRIPKSHVNGLSLYDASKDQIISYISNNLVESSCKEIMDHTDASSREEVIEYLTSNCLTLKYNNPPIANAPDRDLMPQTSKDPDSIEDLSHGVTKV